MEFTSEELNEKAQQLHDSLSKQPLGEETVVNILSETSNQERQIIRAYYKNLYNTPIQDDIYDSLDSNLRDLALDMFDTPAEYDSRELHDAIHSSPIDDDTIIEILTSRPKEHLDIVDQAYEKFYGNSLRDDIKNEINGEYIELLLALLDNERPKEQTITGNDAYNTAQQLYNYGLDNYGKNIDLFKNVFIDKSREDLILISRAFNEKFKKDLYDTIIDQVSGNIQKVLSVLLYAIITPAELFAKKISKAIDSDGTDKKTINRVLISRSDIDMYAVRDYYSLIRNTDLKNDIENGISGAYGQVLVNLSQK